MQQFGQFLLHITFLATLVCAAAAAVGAKARRHEWIVAARHGLYGVALLTVVMGLVVLHSLVTHDFSNKYVATYTDVDMPLAYIVAAFWGGEKGALLFWTLSLSIFGALAVHKSRYRDPVYLGYSLATLLGALFFFYMLMVLESSPFESFLTYGGPRDGKGMNPLLQNPTMTIHPPSLLTGYIAFTIPFAFGFGALLSGKLDNDWAKDTRTWTIVSWVFLTIGLILGGMWAYEELGWGGYWAWDPVENAGFIPWLTATAFLHSVMIQEKRGILKRWNFFLVLLTFLLTIFGTFLTRSQLIDSIHAFADSTLATYFLWYMFLIAGASAAALAYRWEALKAAARIEAFLSRESMFVLNNVVLLGLAFVVMWGTVFSKVSELEAVQGAYNWLVRGYNVALGPWLGEAEMMTQAVVLGEPWFNRVVIPVGLVLLLLTGVGPIIAWGRATRKNFEKNFRFPMAVGTGVTVAGALWIMVVRLMQTHGQLTATAYANWLDQTRYWVESSLSAGQAPGAVPAISAPSWAEAWSTWAASLGRMDIYTFLAFLFSSFVLATIAVEFWVGARARAQKHGGGLAWQMVELTLKARRRYGGYIIHVGVVFAFIAFAGSAFKAEQPEQVVYPGDRIDLSGYHLTLTSIDPTYVADGAYVATRATMVVLKDGETVPPPVAHAVAEVAQTRGWGPVHLETARHSPGVRLRFVRPEAEAEARNAAFLQTYFRKRFALESIPPGSALARFRVKDIDVVQILPPAIQSMANAVRDHFAGVDEGVRVQFTPGSPSFTLRFATTASRDAFVEAYRSADAFGPLVGSRFDDELKALELFPEGLGFTMMPEVRFYRKHPEPTTEVAIVSTPLHDLYIAMRPAAGRSFVNLGVVVLPLVSFLWLGALVMVLGGVICLLPSSLVAPKRALAGAPVAANAIIAALFTALVIALAPAGAGAQDDHGEATPLKALPSSDLSSREEGLARLFSSVKCVARQGGGWVERPGSLEQCATPYAEELRALLRSRFEAHSHEPPAEAAHLALEDFLAAEPANERLLAYPIDIHTHLMTTTNCYCGCSDSMSLSQCPLTCANAREWNTRFKLLLAQGFEVPGIQHVYLGSKNATLGPEDRPWTLEDISTDSRKGITWIVPAVAVASVASLLAWAMARAKRRSEASSHQANVAAASGGSGPQPSLSAEERALLDDELEEWR